MVKAKLNEMSSVKERWEPTELNTCKAFKITSTKSADKDQNYFYCLGKNK